MIAVYPGSFDPLTVGHREIIQRAARLFDRVYVVVLVNPAKRALFSVEKRVEMIDRCVSGLSAARALGSEKSLIEVARSLNADVLLRGLRAEADYLTEKPVADAFLELCGMETLFMQCAPEFGYVSSSLVRELLGLGAPIDRLVPPEIYEQVLTERSE